MGESVTFTCSILNGNALTWQFEDKKLFFYRNNSTCGDYMVLHRDQFPEPFKEDAHAGFSSVMARRSDGSSPNFNCSSILWVNTTTPVDGSIYCKTALGVTVEVSESHSYKVLGKIIES